jgi:predicted dehydrogenase/flavin reductase (DIM6/NTAB) family NADH-FMN oxidoreductase RutF
MRRPAATIWDTKVQVACAAVSVREGDDVELWMCGNFGQVSLDPPRIAINPNRTYPIDAAVLRERRFALNVFPPEARAAVIRLMRIPRRTPGKARIAGLATRLDPGHMIPYLEQSMRTLFCEVEEALDTGDHRVIIARVLEDRGREAAERRIPLMYVDVAGRPSRFPRARKVAAALLDRSGAGDVIRRALARRRGPRTTDLAATTRESGGLTDDEVARSNAFGVRDLGRVSVPPPMIQAGPLRRRVRVCVVGVGQWGAFHCELFRREPMVDLYVCGRDRDRTERVARRVGAAGVIIGLERAVEDPAVEALVLVLPHQAHRHAAELALAAGKHVLVEKPIALTLDDADRMIDAARRAGRILMVAENFHFRPGVRVALEAMERGDIGEPQFLHAHGGGVMRPAGWKAQADQMGGGIIMDLGIHYVRALRLLMGEPDAVLAAHGLQVNPRMGGEDSAQLLFRSRWGWQAHMLLNWSGPRGAGPDIVLCGSGGVLSLYPHTSYVEHVPSEGPGYLQYAHYIRPAWLAQRLTRSERLVRRIPIPDPDVVGYVAEVREFLSAIVDDRPARGTARDGRRDLEVILAAYDALRKDGWVGVPPFSDGVAG